MNATAQRVDFTIYNEATAFSITSVSAVKKIISQNLWGNMKRLFENGLAIGIQLYQDDEFNVRIVVNDELKNEEKQWLACVTGQLNIPCGKPMVCGGFDKDVLLEFYEAGKSEYVASINISPGEYRVNIYTYLNSINGEGCLPEDMKLGAWFRQSHPGKPFPLWMAERLEAEPEGDPDYEDVWENSKTSVQNGTLSVDENESALIDFLIQLRPVAKEVVLSSVDNEAERGFFLPTAGLRKLDRCPLGVFSTSLPPAEYWVEFLED
jgi:hypothetical protein